MDTTDVAVVGAGLAGVKVAFDLARKGYSVVLLERARTLGGRAGSHAHGKYGLLDVGQHVYLGCCYEYRHLLQDLGTAHLAPLEKRIDLTLVNGSFDHSRHTPARKGERYSARLKAASLPYPLSLAAAIMRYDHLSLHERVATVRLMLKAKNDWKLNRSALNDINFSDWLEQSGTSSNARDALWDPLIVATLNADPNHVCADAGVMVIVRALLGGKEAANIGIPRAPLSELLAPIEEKLSKTGDNGKIGGLRLGTSVRSLLIEQGRASGVVLADGNRIKADSVVVATAHPDVSDMIADHRLRATPFFHRIEKITSYPIVNVHFWTDRPITDKKMLGFIRSPLQWLFDLTALTTAPDTNPAESFHGDNGNSHHYTLSISDAASHIDRKSVDLIEEMKEELRRLLPGAKNANFIDATVRKMRHATFGSSPREYQLRPGNETPVAGLYVAGDYTTTGWPSTMESAVISGRQCAELVTKKMDHRR